MIPAPTMLMPARSNLPGVIPPKICRSFPKRPENKQVVYTWIYPAPAAAKGRELLDNVLGKTVRPPLTTIQTLEQMKEARKGPDDIPLKVATPIVHAMLDKQYREILDEPVGLPGSISPRSAIRTPWLK